MCQCVMGINDIAYKLYNICLPSTFVYWRFPDDIIYKSFCSQVVHCCSIKAEKYFSITIWASHHNFLFSIFLSCRGGGYKSALFEGFIGEPSSMLIGRGITNSSPSCGLMPLNQDAGGSTGVNRRCCAHNWPHCCCRFRRSHLYQPED